MKADDGQYLPIERLEKLRAERWRVAQGGFDAVLLEESGRHAARAREAFDSRVERLEWGATASAVLCAAAACECRVSEYLAHWEFASGDLPPELNAIRSDPSALSQWRTLVRYRSPHFNIGTSSEYQRLGCLLRTRD